MLIYADTSALIKLLVREPETTAMRWFMEDVDVLASSRITEVEISRVALRIAGSIEPNLKELLGQVLIREVTPDIARSAAKLQPAELRSLDAIHLATAIELGEELDAFLTYDKRLAEAAKRNGLTVAMPA